MDNTRDIPGYKYYVDEATGERPAIHVAFLDLEPDPDTTVNGVVFPVTKQRLAELDARERSYQRREVAPDTWAYFGRPAPKERARRDNVVVQRAYFESVRGGFARLGSDQSARFEASTDAPRVPIRDLRRIDLAR
jgi:gamma-glutamyl AIG2-like cyclotransferase